MIVLNVVESRYFLKLFTVYKIKLQSSKNIYDLFIEHHVFVNYDCEIFYFTIFDEGMYEFPSFKEIMLILE